MQSYEITQDQWEILFSSHTPALISTSMHVKCKYPCVYHFESWIYNFISLQTTVLSKIRNQTTYTNLSVTSIMGLKSLYTNVTAVSHQLEDTATEVYLYVCMYACMSLVLIFQRDVLQVIYHLCLSYLFSFIIFILKFK